MMLSLDELEKWGMAAEKQIYDDRKAIDRARSFEKETREAFNDISKSNRVGKCFQRVLKIDIYLSKDEPIESKKIYVYSYDRDEFDDNIADIVYDFAKKELLNEQYFKHNSQQIDRYMLINALEKELNSKNDDKEYWVSILRNTHVDYIRHIECQYVQIMALEFNRSHINSEFGEGENRHVFIKGMHYYWHGIFDRYSPLNFDFGELFRRSALYDALVNYYINDINALAFMRYENADNYGKLIVDCPFKKFNCDNFLDYYNADILLKEYIHIEKRNYKKIRKLLEICKDKEALLANAYGDIYGIGSPREGAGYYIIQFNGAGRWALSKNNKQLLQFDNTMPSIPEINKGITIDDITLLKKTFPNKDVSPIISIIEHAIKQKHGTMVVFSTMAKTEATRLQESSIPIEQKKVTGTLVEAATSIDGAMLCDEEGICYAIGTILDGKASPNADSSRGARFNSAIRYIEQQQKDKFSAFLVIVSEDGYINCMSSIPSLT